MHDYSIANFVISFQIIWSHLSHEATKLAIQALTTQSVEQQQEYNIHLSFIHGKQDHQDQDFAWVLQNRTQGQQRSDGLASEKSATAALNLVIS